MKVPISRHDVIDLDAPMLAAVEVKSERTGAVRWKVWCGFCQAWHFHGAGEGHRGSVESVSENGI